jgi:gliding motility-associated-like protein
MQLSATINGPGNHYSWSPPDYINDIHSLQPTINPPADAQYILNAVSDFGCGVSADTMLVKVYNGVFVPTAFSPNGDSRNDTWNVPALGAYSKFELSIFNRYGERVFYLKDVNQPWDGNYKGMQLPVGTYCYFIDLKNQAPMMRGTVTIIR